MCMMKDDCELHEKVDEILKCQENIITEQKDLRRDFDTMNRLVKNHDDILSKIDVKIAEGVTLGVDRSLKGLDERVGSVVKKELQDAEYLKLKEEKERKKGWADHAVKQVIGIVITGIIGVVVILFQLANNTDLNKQITQQNEVIQAQKEALQSYENQFKDLQEEINNLKK